MLNSGNKHLIVFLTCLALAVFLGVSGVGIHKTLTDKAQQQERITFKFKRWVAAYKPLRHVETKWAESFMSDAKIDDLLALHANLRLSDSGLISDPDKINVSSTPTGSFKDVKALGLKPVCVKSNGNAFAVSASSYTALYKGLARLVNRPDVRIGKLIIDNSNGLTAHIYDFCVLVRKDTKGV